jgi:protoporphyrinogen/coproporphyrinogen III oxidase
VSASPDPRPGHVLVVGGGIAGLAAAWSLDAAGMPVTVLEGAPEPGGHARTVREDGFVVELGPNGFLARADEPEPLALVRGVGLEPAMIEADPRAKRRFIWERGRLARVPESPPGLVTSNALSLGGKLRLLAEPWAKGPPAGVEETVFEFAARRIGREAATRLVDTAISGISAGDSRELSVGAAFPRMVAMEREHGSLIKAMIARRGGMPRLVGFEGGLVTLVQGIAARLGPRLRTRAAAARLERAGARWRVTTAAGEAFTADTVLLAVPAWHGAELLGPLDAAAAAPLVEIASAGVAMVALAYAVHDLRRPLDGYGFLVAREANLDTLGVVWESSLFAGRAPADHVLLRVMMGGARRPGLAALGEDELVARARAELARTMSLTAEPTRTWVARHPRAIAQYLRGHGARVAAARARTAALGGIALCGSSYDGVSFSAAIISGMRAAERLTGGRSADAGIGTAQERATA